MNSVLPVRRRYFVCNKPRIKILSAIIDYVSLGEPDAKFDNESTAHKLFVHLPSTHSHNAKHLISSYIKDVTF